MRSRMGESDAVDDVMQNIALALVKQKESLGEINRISAWLYQVAVKQVLMYRRTRGRQRNFEKRILEHARATDADGSLLDDPAGRVMRAENQDNVKTAMGQLEELDRQLLMLKYSENWTYRQLAEHMGVKEDTIEYRLVKARKHLRRQLAANDIRGRNNE